MNLLRDGSVTSPKDFEASAKVANISELGIGLWPDCQERLVKDVPTGRIMVNAAGFSGCDQNSIHVEMRQAVRDAAALAALDGSIIQADINPQRLNDDLIQLLDSDKLDLRGIDLVRQCLAAYAVAVMSFKMPLSPQARYRSCCFALGSSIARYGNVELRVIENYLRNPGGLMTTIAAMTREPDNEAGMYARGAGSNYLATDDLRWNLRMLMTNAGFYVQDSEDSATRALANWCEHTLCELRTAQLVTYPAAYPFYFAIQQIIWHRFGEIPNYVQHPNVFEIYNALAGREVIFMSPMAHLVTRQVESGRLWRLYEEYQVPRFDLRALPAWVSTWPNRPHAGWSETFTKMCASVDAAHRERPFDIFMASCGCYGLPICNYARTAYGCSTIYLGNMTHALFGIRQSATKGLMKRTVNHEAWIDSDLGQFPNMARIDAGRYI